MKIKDSPRSRRQVTRSAWDSRPIVGMYDVPPWQIRLERMAPLGCLIIAIFTLGIGIYAWASDASAGLLH